MGSSGTSTSILFEVGGDATVIWKDLHYTMSEEQACKLDTRKSMVKR